MAPLTAGTRTLSLPDFARGPGQPVVIGAAGPTLRIDDAQGLRSLDVELTWDPTQLDVSAADVAAALPDGWSITTNTLEPGRMRIALYGIAAIEEAGPLDLIILTASVPDTAPYGASGVLMLGSLALNEGGIAARGDVALHKVAYFGDTSGSATFSGLDASFIARVATGRDSGFDAFDLTDPHLLGDVTGDGVITALDAAWVAREAVGSDQPEVPDLPGVIPPILTPGPDPVVSLPTATPLSPGSSVSLPVMIDDATGLQAFDFQIQYDPELVTLAAAEVAAGSLLGSADASWSLVTRADAATGTLFVTAYSTEGLVGGPGELIRVGVTAEPGATGTTPLDIGGQLNEGRLVMTDVDGTLILVPADADPPRVTEVLVSGQSWSSSFLNAVDPGRGLGYSLPTGADQSLTLPWTNLDQISLVFSEGVSVDVSDLSLAGVDLSAFEILGFTYDEETFTATWIFAQPLQTDRFAISLDGVFDASGNALDGEWTDGTSTTSGDGIAGGAFNYGFNVLQGDTVRSGFPVVLGDDLLYVRDRQFTFPGFANYDYFADLNGDGVILGDDLLAVRDRQFTFLP